MYFSDVASMRLSLSEKDLPGIDMADGNRVRIYWFPRDKYEYLLALVARRKVPELSGVYFLLDTSGGPIHNRVYIGKSGNNMFDRLKARMQKGFSWDQAIIAVDRIKANGLTEKQITFLEKHSIDEVEKAGGYLLANKKRGEDQQLDKATEAVCLAIFKDMSELLASQGFPFFRPVGPLYRAIRASRLSSRAEDRLERFCSRFGRTEK